MLWNAKNGRVPLGGTDMDYAAFGYGRQALVLLPGLSDGLATVRGKALLLAKPYRMFFEKYTVYMFSRKNRMPEGWSIRDMAADQAAAMKALGLEKAAVMGVSQGGMIAQCLAADHAELVGALVLAVTAPRVNGIIRPCVENWIRLAKQGDHRQLMIDTAEKSYSEKYLKKYRKLYPVIGAVGKPADYGRFLVNAEAILRFEGAEGLKDVSCPVLIIGGTEDRIVGPEASRELKALIPGSELYMYEGLGHATYEEAPDFNERVFGFLEREMLQKT